MSIPILIVDEEKDKLIEDYFSQIPVKSKKVYTVMKKDSFNKIVQKGPGKCPRCGSYDVFWNDSQVTPDTVARFNNMYCEKCNKTYTAVYEFKQAEYYD